MNGFLLLLIISGLIFSGLFSFSLKWYQTKEVREKRTLDLQILALESGGGFREKDETFDEKLLRYHLGYKQGRTVRNIRSHTYIGYTIDCFDFSLSAGENSRTDEDLNGILIKLEGRHFPRFHISHKHLLNWFNLSGYAKLPKRFKPEWFPHTAFVFADEIDYFTVFSRLDHASELKEIISRRDFEKMLFRSEYVAIYFRGQLPADFEHYQQQSALAAKIAHIFNADTHSASADRFELGIGMEHVQSWIT